LAVSSLFLSFSTAAADSTDDPIVVTATRVATPIEHIGSSVTVIGAEEIAGQQWRTVAEALASVPGLRVAQSGGPGTQTSVFMRGANSSHTLVLIDGVKANDPSSPSGAYDFGNMLLNNVERIEIVRGPQSTLYGSDAIGGVINVITRRGHGKFQGYGQIEGGSFHTLSEATGLSGSEGRFRYAMDLAHTESDGQDITPARLRAGMPAEDDGFRNTTLSASLGFSPTSNTELNLVSRYSEARSQLDVGSGEDYDSESTARQATVRGEARGAFFDGVWKPLLAVSNTQHRRQNINERQSSLGDEDHTEFDGERELIELQNDFYLGSANILTLGAEYQKETMKSSGTSIFGSAFGDFIITQDTNTSARSRSFYLLDQFGLGNRLRASAGVRLDDYDTFDPVTTYRVTPIYVIPETATKLKASYGTGFKAPSLFERFGSSPTNSGTAFTGNPNLLPEESTGWEVGVEQAAWGGRLDTGVTYFSNRIENLIQTIFLPSFDSTTVNIGRAETWGVEFFEVVRPATDLQFRLDYTYTRTQDATGLELLRRPRHSARLNVEYRLTAQSRITLESLYVGERQDVDRVTGLRVTDDDYTLVNLAATADLSRHLSIFGRVDNLFNRDFEPVNGFQGSGMGFIIGVRAAL
jgi:vitamin B12 transporter